MMAPEEFNRMRNYAFTKAYAEGVRSVLRKVPTVSCPAEWAVWGENWDYGYRTGAEHAVKFLQAEDGVSLERLARMYVER